MSDPSSDDIKRSGSVSESSDSSIALSLKRRLGFANRHSMDVTASPRLAADIEVISPRYPSSSSNREEEEEKVPGGSHVRDAPTRRPIRAGVTPPTSPRGMRMSALPYSPGVRGRQRAHSTGPIMAPKPSFALTEREPRHHEFESIDQKKPASCEYCKKFIWGMGRNGIRCVVCKKEYHQKCIGYCSNRCRGQFKESVNAFANAVSQPQAVASTSASVSSSLAVAAVAASAAAASAVPSAALSSSAWRDVRRVKSKPMLARSSSTASTVSGNSTNPETGVTHGLQSVDDIGVDPDDNWTNEEQNDKKLHMINGHRFYVTSFKRPAFCDHCGKFVWGLARQGYKCQACKFVTHKRCHQFALPCVVRRRSPSDTGTNLRLDAAPFQQRSRRISEETSGSPLSCSESESNASLPELEHELAMQTTLAAIPDTAPQRRVLPTLNIRTLEPQPLQPCVITVAQASRDNTLVGDETTRYDSADSNDHAVAHDGSSDYPPMYTTLSLSSIDSASKRVLPDLPVGPSSPPHLSHLPRSQSGPTTRALPLRPQQPSLDLPSPNNSVFDDDSLVDSSEFVSDTPSSPTTLYAAKPCTAASTPGASNNTLSAGDVLISPPSPSSPPPSIRNVPLTDPPKRRALATLRGGPPTKLVTLNGGSGPVRAPDPMLIVPCTRERESSDVVGPTGEYTQNYQDEGKILGVGQFGIVTRCRHRLTGQHRAVKTISKKRFMMRKKLLQDLQSEIDILLGADHFGIVQICEVFETDWTLYIVMELMECGDLLDYTLARSKLAEHEAKFFFYQIMLAVEYLHNLGISHRDLKPDNILLTTGGRDVDVKDYRNLMVKIGDFGFAKVYGESTFMKSVCGTPAYVAPEVMEKGPSRDATGYTCAVDMWSLGVMLFLAMSGSLPFDDGPSNVRQKRKGVKFTDNIWNDVTSSAKDLIQKMTVFAPSDRISVQDAMLHDWFEMSPEVPEFYMTLYGYPTSVV